MSDALELVRGSDNPCENVSLPEAKRKNYKSCIWSLLLGYDSLKTANILLLKYKASKSISHPLPVKKGFLLDMQCCLFAPMP